MRRVAAFLALGSLFCCGIAELSADDPASAPAQGVEFFEKKIRPVLVEHCYQCHSAEADEVMAGLRLDHREALRTGGDSGAAIVPNNPEESLLIQALRYDGLEMPPDRKLPDRVIDDFVTWIRAGAHDPRTDAPGPSPDTPDIDWTAAREFWSYRPIERPEIPPVRNSVWTRTGVDNFILNRLETAGLQPVEAADKRTLLRRVTLTLTGLPPTAEEIDAFLADDRPGGYARVVDRLLASPHYGERWARHWLDVARYAEDQAHSFKPRLYPNGFRYRDWLVRAFNEDMPYDRFILCQLAADLLEGPDRREHLPALGFFACGPVYYGDKLKFDQWDDRIDTLTRGVLGLTVACARCHDHKFDPISTNDYYALAGVFASTEYVESPLVPDKVVQAFEQAQAAIEKQQKEIDEFLASESKRLDVSPKRVERELPDVSRARLAEMRARLDRLQTQAPPPYPQAHALSDAEAPRDLPVNLRGNPATPGEVVPRRFLQVLDDDLQPFQHGSGRLELARAIIAPENPLTARVIVNRLWQHHFGRGLVATSSNFGTLGEAPTHPELLDYLAGRLVDSGWSLKAIHREILLSATYRLSSRDVAENARQDGNNRLLWRMNRRRLEVEPWRDAMLMAGGRLDRALGGPSRELDDRDNHRRTLYAKVSRHDLNPLLRMFDFPDPNITSGERSSTTVPLQQLFVLNSPFIEDRARDLAARICAQSDDNVEQRVRRAYRMTFGREPSGSESARAMAFLQMPEAAEVAQAGPAPEASSKPSPWEQFAQALLSSNEFLYVD